MSCWALLRSSPASWAYKQASKQESKKAKNEGERLERGDPWVDIEAATAATGGGAWVPVATIKISPVHCVPDFRF